MFVPVRNQTQRSALTLYPVGILHLFAEPFTDEAQTALFKDPVRTAL